MVYLFIKLSLLDVKNGIDFETFFKGIEEFGCEDQNYIKKIFSYANKTMSGILLFINIFLDFLNWNDFLDAIKIIRVNELNEKIDLFFKVCFWFIAIV